MEHIYLDHAATTPLHPKVLESMLPIYQKVFGNPSSIHYFGREARKLVDDARENIAKAIGAKPNEIVFTSGGTEADNTAIIGTAMAMKAKGNHIITSKIEHHAVLHTCQYLETQGFEVTYLDVDEKGRIQLDEFQQAIREDTILVTVMYGNNEVGTIQPIREMAQILEEHSALFHTDAVQAFGVKKVEVQALGVDLMSMVAHKINGPKGVGFLYVKEGTPFSPYQHGGEQERKRRAGTHNVPGIVGLEKALVLAAENRDENDSHYRRLQTIILQYLEEQHIDFSVNGDVKDCLSHILNLYFPGIKVEPFLTALDLGGVAVSSGSACTAGSVEPSHVLSAMYGKEAEQAKSSIRISFGLYNTEEQVTQAAKIIAQTVKRML
ncbi:cysteine desulfurase [Pullulanibacillus pueri]|uniref:Putative cysteine desulfurase IscS 1 n=1 Tax=Pullulanibacillus pueri TaxID=1437324 RepID=A0A8J2ZY84_9BACL|nr:cysteine desulfurase family protein [Pullulanibacillus pueri]MBM7683250.1 cysteine desulfurase [Pullulanibacillus pueri]GGH85729.1 putative cysteine desulfurase IscS 1 [Pullulanibacillus pueri]